MQMWSLDRMALHPKIATLWHNFCCEIIKKENKIILEDFFSEIGFGILFLIALELPWV